MMPTFNSFTLGAQCREEITSVLLKQNASRKVFACLNSIHVRSWNTNAQSQPQSWSIGLRIRIPATKRSFAFSQRQQTGSPREKPKRMTNVELLPTIFQSLRYHPCASQDFRVDENNPQGQHQWAHNKGKWNRQSRFPNSITVDQPKNAPTEKKKKTG